ncbi:MAG: FtsX-like permease family protein [Candidatus Microbacterium phytovorans]|uniref:FtsX-like permease family protein n=1 Tax=Candidatus Microbacterium phytovorans TaxID=3121374 RepID=A0AAJ5VZU4_9MICO|nr:FtsX-like permease family protein [Microbacterium sp.]WEK12464.1 MAG: FtsX-like permease family protein [Microbacterium sp.]
MTARSPGLFALTRRRFATPRSAAIVIVALTALAAFVIAAAPRALVGVVRAEVAHQISGVAATSRDLTGSSINVPVFAPAPDAALTDGWDAGAPEMFGALAGQLAAAREDFDPVLRDLTAPAEFAEHLSAGAAADPTGIPADVPLPFVQVISEPAAATHVRVVDGAWPEAWSGDGPIPILLTVSAAETMAWTVGEERTPFVLAGIGEAVDPDADRWLHLITALTASVYDDGNRRPTATSAGWVAPETWAALTQSGELGRTQLSLWYPVDGAGARDADPTALLSAVRGATTASVALDPSGQLRTRLSSDLVSVLSTGLSRANSASAILAVAAVGPLAVSVALIVLASALIVRRRRSDLALLSARGAPLARLRRLLFGEGLLLGAPAAVAGALAGVLLTANDAGWMPTVCAVLVGFAPAAALAATLRRALLTRARADLDAPSRGRWVRVGELIVVLVAVAAVVQLVLRGIGTDTTTIDPLVIIAPLLATVALALLVVRLHPVPLAAALAASRRRRGVVGLVGAARNLRDPSAGTTAVLAMVVAVAIAVFSSVVLATVDRGAVVAAQRDVGADVRLAGPYFDEGTVERLRAVDGVADAVGILRGDFLTIAGESGSGAGQATDSVLAFVTETDRAAEAQRGYVGAFPGGVNSGADPLEIVASTSVAAEVGSGDVTLLDRPARVVGTIPALLGATDTTEFVVLDAADYTALTGLGFYPRTVLVDLEDGIDPRDVLPAIQDAVGQTHTTRVLADSTAEIQASPAVTALRFVLFGALGIAALLSVIALLLVAGVSRDARSRVIALLRTMGLDRARARGIVAWEFAPLGITALVGGVLLGAALPLLVVASIDLRPFTGGGAQPSLTVDPALSGALIAVVVVALALAVVAGVLSARTVSMATVLRTEED